MNEILKFKKDRQIVKALGGTKTRYNASNLVHAGRDTGGGYLYYDNRTGDLVKVNSSPDLLKKDGWTVGGIVSTAAELKSNPYTSWGINWGWNPFHLADVHAFGPYLGKLQGDQELSSKITVDGQEYASADDWRRKRLNRQQGVVTVGNPTVVRGNVGRSRVTPRGQQYWDDEFAKFTGGLSLEQRDWLKTNGLNNATKLQEYLNNMGFSVGKFGVDGKFANDSKTAWNNFVASGTMGKNNDLEILAKQLAEQPVIDAPDPFGYKTSNTYEGNDFANRMKSMGIQSNADLIDFMHKNSNGNFNGDAWAKQFHSDVNKALGGDYSDSNIRKIFGTQGKWGNGFMGRGDFGDFQNALQTNAGVWNGIYDKNQSDARMDAARQQLATKMAQQYTTQLTKPTAPKFMTNNFGINTLGDIDGLKGDPIYGKWVG